MPARRVLAERSNLDMSSDQQDPRTREPAKNFQDVADSKSKAHSTMPNIHDPHSQMLSVPFYFTSPLTTLLESLRDPDCTQVTLHDVMEAYDCFSDRLRSVADVLLLHAETTRPTTPSAFRIIEERSSEIAQVLERDMRRPFSRTLLTHSQHTFDMYPYSTSNPFSAGDADDDDNRQRVLDSAKLAQHALCFVSDICIFKSMYSLFSASDLQSIINALFAYTIPHDLPIMNETKLCTLVVWILQTQRLPTETLLLSKGDISSTISRAVKGDFGIQAVMDGLKAVHSLLLRPEAVFLSSLAGILSTILEFTINESFDIRLASMYAISGFAYAVIQANDEPETYRPIRYTLHAFIENQHKKRKDAPSGISLGKIVEDAVSTTKPQHLGNAPCWALTFISSLIIILDYTIFFRPHCVKLLFFVLHHTGHHKRSAVRELHPHIWKLLIWAYLRIPVSVDKVELGDIVDPVDIRKRTYKVVSQDPKSDIGIALVAALLRDDYALTCATPLADRVEDALSIVRDMVQSSNDSVWRNGFMLFERLYGYSEEDSQPKHRENRLLCQTLFDGSLLSVDVKALPDLVNSIPSFTVDAVRQLSNEEIYSHWKPTMSLWVAVAKLCLKETDSMDSQISDTVFSIWISLLEIFVQRCDGLTPSSSPTGLSSSVVMLAAQLLDTSDDPAVQVRHLKFVKRVWSIAKNVLYDTWLPSNAEIVLAAVLKRNFLLGNDDVRLAWSDLCAELISVGVPTLLHILYFQSEKKEQVEVLRQLWMILVRTWHVVDHGTTWDDLVTLLVVPFGSWSLSNREFEQWESILRNAIRLADQSPTSDNAVIRLFFERLGSNRKDAFKAKPRALYSVLRHFVISSCKKLDRKFFQLVDDTLLSLYPPLPELLAACIDALCALGELISTCPDHILVELISVVQRSACLWLQDETSVLLQTEQNIVVNALYSNTLDRLIHFEPTIERLNTLTPFLASVFKARNICEPALGPSSFENFWRSTYHGKGLQKLYPDDIKACLKSLSLAWGGSIAGDLTVTSDSQKSVSIVPDSQVTPRNRHRSQQPHPIHQSPFDAFLSPRRHSSVPPSSPHTPLARNERDVETRRAQLGQERDGPTTPTNRQAPLHHPDLEPRSTFTSPETEVFRREKRMHSPVGFQDAKLRCSEAGARSFGYSSPQYIYSAIQKASSEPAPELSTSIISEARTMPSPTKKRKLFDYVILTPLRSVRRRTSLHDYPTIPLPHPLTDVEATDHEIDLEFRDISSSSISYGDRDSAKGLDRGKGGNSSPGHALDFHNLESRDRSQSMPAIVTHAAQSENLQATPVQRQKSTHLEAVQHAYHVIAETGGVSQVPVHDLVQASRMVTEMAATLNNAMSRKLAENVSEKK